VVWEDIRWPAIPAWERALMASWIGDRMSAKVLAGFLVLIFGKTIDIVELQRVYEDVNFKEFMSTHWLHNSR
jgi:hypothetical protein